MLKPATVVWQLRKVPAAAGVLLCDTYLAARELVKEVDYTLTTLARELLQEQRSDLNASDVPG